MSQEKQLSRRGFVKLCASTVATVSTSRKLLAEGTLSSRAYNRVRLVDNRNRPLRAKNLQAGENHLFHYPYVSTPCFVVDVDTPLTGATALRTEAGKEYQWRGGVGPQNSVVAFSAICSHRMTHPAKAVSFINYRHDETRFRGDDDQMTARSQVIYCCSERSVYDVRQGARVIGGPAPQPLAAVILEYDGDEDSLYAIGTAGGEMFEEFFEKFGFRLALEHETSNIRQQVENVTRVMPLREYCRTQVLC